MTEPVKFPDMRPRTPPKEIVPPAPSSYVQRMPAFPTSDFAVKNRRFERKRLWFWFGVAVALHAALLIGIWLSPPLRIKWEPAPEAWVQVTSLPKPVPPVPEVPSAPTVPARAGVPGPVVPHKRAQGTNTLPGAARKAAGRHAGSTGTDAQPVPSAP